jgi:hypothetical protein
MTDEKEFGSKVYVPEYIRLLKRVISNLETETDGRENAYFKTMPIIEIVNTKVAGAESEELRRDDYVAEVIANWEVDEEC